MAKHSNVHCPLAVYYRRYSRNYILQQLDQFQPETVSALTPAIRNVNDLQKLKQLLLAAARVRNIEDFTQMLYE